MAPEERNGETRLRLLEEFRVNVTKRLDEADRECDAFQSSVWKAMDRNAADHASIKETLSTIGTDIKWMKWLPTVVGSALIGLLIYIFKTHTHP